MRCTHNGCMLIVPMPKAVQIRDVPDDAIAVLRTRAAAAGMSMSEYLRSELVRLASAPTMDEWLARVATPPTGHRRSRRRRSSTSSARRAARSRQAIDRRRRICRRRAPPPAKPGGSPARSSRRRRRPCTDPDRDRDASRPPASSARRSSVGRSCRTRPDRIRIDAHGSLPTPTADGADLGAAAHAHGVRRELHRARRAPPRPTDHLRRPPRPVHRPQRHDRAAREPLSASSPRVAQRRRDAGDRAQERP